MKDKGLNIIIVILVLLIIGVGVYFLFFKEEEYVPIVDHERESEEQVISEDV